MAAPDFRDNRPADCTDDARAVIWMERALPRIMRRLMDAENLDMPLLQLPLAQMRLAQALYDDAPDTDLSQQGETMGRLAERLNVRGNALTQAADRLINHQLAERLHDPQDRRLVRLRLTPTGREWVGARRARRRAHLHRLWEMLSGAEREELIQALCILEAAGERLAAPMSAREDTDSLAGNETTPDLSEETVEETLQRLAYHQD